MLILGKTFLVVGDVGVYANSILSAQPFCKSKNAVKINVLN